MSSRTIQCRKPRRSSQQSRRSIVLEQMPTVHQCDLVVSVDEVQPMHDSYDGAVLELGVDDLLHQRLRLTVDASDRQHDLWGRAKWLVDLPAHRLVQQQDLAGPQHSPREAKELLLANGPSRSIELLFKTTLSFDNIP